jgi:hypothetical protein
MRQPLNACFKKMDTPYHSELIVCLGNGNFQANALAEEIAQQHNLTYHGILDNDSTLLSGCWHTSIYDIRLTQLKNKLDTSKHCRIIVLDQRDQDYLTIQDYFNTIDLAQELSESYTVEYLDPDMQNTFRTILKQNKSFCILPFIGININDTTIRNCCWQKPFRDSSTLDFVNDSTLTTFREQMLAGVQVPSCQTCYDIEKTQAVSPRQDYTLNWVYKLGYKSLEHVSQDIKLRHYEITLGNKCNAMCRMCSPESSHLIDKEYYQLGLRTKTIGLQQANHFDQIDLDSVMRLHVAGGESTVSEQFENFLQRCIAQKKTNFEMYVSTNASAVSKKFINLIKPFENLNCIISVDGFEDANLYIRWPIKWDKFCANVEQLTQNLDQKNYGFNTVVSIYNVSRLYELYSFIDSHYPDAHCNLTYLTDPDILVPWNFVNKNLVLENLEKIKSLNLYKKQEIFRSKIDGLASKISLSHPNPQVLAKFFKFNDQLDQSRGVKLKDYIPELEACRSAIA